MVIKNKRLKIIIIMVCIGVFILLAFSYVNHFQKINRVLVFVPKEYEGKILIFFNKPGYPPLVRKKIGYYATINKGVLFTSTSFGDREMRFLLVRLDSETNQYYRDTSSSFLNYSYRYCGQPHKTLNNYLKNEEFYVGFFYKDDHKVSKDSLNHFLKSIGSDTMLIKE